MDGGSSVSDIALGHFVERGGFVAERLGRLVRRLRADGFLGPVPPDLDAMLASTLAAQTRIGRIARLAGRLISIDLVRAPWLDRLLSSAYANGGWLLYTRPARLLWVLIILTGLIAWWSTGADGAAPTFSNARLVHLGAGHASRRSMCSGSRLYQIAQGLGAQAPRLHDHGGGPATCTCFVPGLPTSRRPTSGWRGAETAWPSRWPGAVRDAGAGRDAGVAGIPNRRH